jgi:hypothetical protein
MEAFSLFIDEVFNKPQYFTAILSGSHEISISDANGCGSTIFIVFQIS